MSFLLLMLNDCCIKNNKLRRMDQFRKKMMRIENGVIAQES